LHTGDAGFAEVLDLGLKIGPGILVTNKFEGFILTKVARKDVVLVLEDADTKVVGIRYIDSVIKLEVASSVN
jgi:3-hydroxyacyl-CoA dehydrogenase